MCDEHFEDYIFSIVLTHDKTKDCRVLSGKISVLNSDGHDLNLIFSKFKNFLDTTFGDEKC